MSARPLMAGARLLAVALATAAFGAAVASPSSAFTLPALRITTIHVNTTADETNPGDGACSLREAIDYVDGQAEPDCAPGTASEPTVIDLPASTSRYVLFQGTTLVIDARFPVIISGGETGSPGTTIDGRSPINGAAVGPVLDVVSGDVTLEGLTVTGGQAPGGATPGSNGSSGGGIVNSGSLTLSKVSVTGNAAGSGAGFLAQGSAGGSGGSGGGIENFGTLSVDFSTISDNGAGVGAGGGIASGCGASPPGGDGGNGGGIDNQGGTVSIVGSTITANTAGRGGGGGGSSCSGVAGGAGGAGGVGAGVNTDGGAVTVSDSTISGNAAGDGGTGPYSEDCLSAGPGGGGGAGGAIASDSALSVLNTTIASNTAGQGGLSGVTTGDGCEGGIGGSGGSGGAIAQFGFATVTNATIGGNSVGLGGDGTPAGSAGAGAGIFENGGSMDEHNTIVEGGCAGTVSDGGHDLQFGGSGCPGLIGNPELGPLQNNGGLTETMAPGITSFALGQVPATGTECPATDQRGDPRPDDSETVCDIGAVEVQEAAFLVCSTCRGVLAGGTLGPKSFSLRGQGAETNGVKITTVLRTPRTLVLLVRKHAGRRLLLIGYARLGPHPVGRSTFHWNLRAGGKLLPAGTYQLILYGLDNGNVLSLPAAPGVRRLTVLANGKVRT